jgi:hypothetical protein
MERVILVLAMLAGLHLLLSFLRSLGTRPEEAVEPYTRSDDSVRASEGRKRYDFRLAAVRQTGCPAPDRDRHRSRQER